GSKSTVPPAGVSVMAWRSEPGPPSLVFITVESKQRFSSSSSRGRCAAGRKPARRPPRETRGRGRSLNPRQWVARSTGNQGRRNRTPFQGAGVAAPVKRGRVRTNARSLFGAPSLHRQIAGRTRRMTRFPGGARAPAKGVACLLHKEMRESGLKPLACYRAQSGYFVHVVH